MATIGDALAPEIALIDVPQRRVWPRLLVGFVIGLMLTAGIAVAGLFAYDAQHEGRILTGVDVGGVDVSAMDQDQATATLEAAFAGLGEGQVVVRTSARDVVVPYSAFDRRADVAAMVAAAMQVGRSGSMADRAIAEVRLATSGQTVPIQ